MNTKLIYLGFFIAMLIPIFSYSDSRTMEINSAVIQTATNQACSTTCTNGCLFGFDRGVLGVALAHITTCSDATADECLCAW